MRKGTCIHFNGVMPHTHCEAGVRYADVTPEPDRPGSALRVPCNRILHWTNPSPNQLVEFEKRGTCEKYREPTDDELKAHNEMMNAQMKKLTLVIPLVGRIKKEHKGADWKGVEHCPVCGGNLHLRHAAYNGHVWGACETQDCVKWME